MSYCREEGKDGKDRIVFVTKEEMSTPSEAMIAMDEEEVHDGPVGFVQPNGELNFGCPCVGGLHAGPCGYEMREFISCNFYNSQDKEDPRGHECDDKMYAMMQCIDKHEEYYKHKMSSDPEDEDDDPFAITDDQGEGEVSTSHIDVSSSIVTQNPTPHSTSS